MKNVMFGALCGLTGFVLVVSYLESTGSATSVTPRTGNSTLAQEEYFFARDAPTLVFHSPAVQGRRLEIHRGQTTDISCECAKALLSAWMDFSGGGEKNTPELFELAWKECPGLQHGERNQR